MGEVLFCIAWNKKWQNVKNNNHSKVVLHYAIMRSGTKLSGRLKSLKQMTSTYTNVSLDVLVDASKYIT